MLRPPSAALSDQRVLRPRVLDHPAVRLFCIPGVGGGASLFARWGADLPSAVELCCIQPAGRESRLREPLFDDLDAFADVVARDLMPLLDVPYAFFGHSMGALIAYEVALRVRRAHRSLPIHLFVSAHRACHLPNRFPAMHTLPDADLVRELTGGYGGIPAAILGEVELMRALIPVFRADLQMLERYVHRAETPLSCPITVFGGTDDRTVTGDELESWSDHTDDTFKLQLLPGDHFYFRTARRALLTAISADVMGSLARATLQPQERIQ
jgi:medium-chain acyl-[acyl-carrier-protein] hydrolase